MLIAMSSVHKILVNFNICGVGEVKCVLHYIQDLTGHKIRSHIRIFKKTANIL